jgi:HEAT repeat protein
MGVACILLAGASPSAAQVRDLTGGSFRPSPLGHMVRHKPHIVVLEVKWANPDKCIICYRKHADLKGKDPSTEYRHIVGGDTLQFSKDNRDVRALFQWAQPGQLAICFHDGVRGDVCIGNAWYWAEPQKLPGWEVVSFLDQYPSTYVGSVQRLREHVSNILAGDEVTVTAAQDSYDGFHPLIYRDWLRGKKGRVLRARAGLRINDFAHSDESPLFMGWGVGGPEIVPTLVKALGQEDPFVRAEAAEDLGQLGSVARAATPQLRSALKDPDVYVRIHAATALARVEQEKDPPIAVFNGALRDKEPAVRVAAATALLSLGPRCRSAREPLLTALDDPDSAVRIAAILALGELAPDANLVPGSPDPIVVALARVVRQDNDSSARVGAVRMLFHFGAGAWSAAPVLRQALRDEGFGVHREAVELLARFDPPAMELLIEAAQDREGDACDWAIAALGKLGPGARAAIPTLMGLLKEENVHLRLHAAHALLRIDSVLGKKFAMPLFLAGLKDTDSDVWPPVGPRALEVLEEFGCDSTAVAALADLMGKEPDKDVWPDPRRRVAAILGHAGPIAKKAVPVLRAALKNPDAWFRISAAEALAKIGSHPEAIQALIRTMEDSNDNWRGVAANALGRIGPKARVALPALRQALLRKDDDARPAVALTIWRLQKSAKDHKIAGVDRASAVAALIGMAGQDDGRNVQYEALEALATLGAEARPAVPVLIDMVQDQDRARRSLAVAALAAIARQVPEAIAPLCWALDDRTAEVRATAARALLGLERRHPRAVPVLLEALRRDPAAWYFEESVAALGKDARALVPQLKRALRSREHFAYERACTVLQKIDPKAITSVWGISAVAPKAKLPWENLNLAQLRGLWKDLANPDAVLAYRSVWTLVLHGDPAVAFVKEHLKPVLKPAPGVVDRLIAELDSKHFPDRQKATTALEKTLDSAEPALRRALEGQPSLETERRIRRLLDHLDPEKSPERKSALRALEVLQEINSIPSRALLEDLAGGLPGAHLTREARAALDRITTLCSR